MTDIALRYDRDARRFDIAFEAGDLALDATPATAMILSLGCDARARADDRLRAGEAGIGARRGWWGDALDLRGRTAGSRLWLLEAEKQTEEVRQRAERYAAEALAWLSEDRGLAVAVSAEWLRRGVLRLRARAGTTEFAALLPVAG